MAYDVSPGQTIGVSIAMFIGALTWVALVMSGLLISRSIVHAGVRKGLKAHWLWAFVGSLVLLPFAVSLTRGRGLASLMPRWLSVILVEVSLLVGISILIWFMSHIYYYAWSDNNDTRKMPERHWFIMVLVGFIPYLFLICDRKFFWGLYPAFHTLLALLAACCALWMSLASKFNRNLKDWILVIKPRPQVTHWLIVLLLLIGLVVAKLIQIHAPVIHTRALLYGTSSRQIARINMLITRAFPTMDNQARPVVQSGQTVHLQDVIDIGVERPHVIIVSIDGLRASDMSFLGAKKTTTSFLNSIASESLIYTHAYSPAANTADSIAALLTNYTVEPVDSSDADERSRYCAQNTHATRLPQQFSQEGYLSICALVYGLKQLACVTQGCDITLDLVDRAQIFDLFLEQLNNTSKPIFGIMHLLETHAPFRGFDQAVVDETPGWTAYERSILGMDRAVAQFYRRAKQVSDRDILWVFVSDHGESFGEHGFRGHDASLFEQQIHVPLMLHSSYISPGRITTPVSTAWLFASFSAMLKLPVSSPTLPLRPLANAPDEPVPVMMRNGDWYAIRLGDWKYMENRATGESWLFNLVEDPDEQQNRLGSESERAIRMRSQLQ